MCDAYCGGGRETLRAGDGVMALPTLIHRGPGNASTSIANRYVLFFTLRPVYRDGGDGGGGITADASSGDVVAATTTRRPFHTYNPNLQIHAGCVLYNQFRRVMKMYADGGCGLEGTFRSIVGLEASSQICKMKILREENAMLKEENKRLKKDSGALSLLRRENGMLREEIERLRAARASAMEEDHPNTTTTTTTTNEDDDTWELGKPVQCVGFL
ncbi:hypothetical protein ACHAXA_008499 [Cyclostephanos tholiformis]|uniref:Uncharacterized protein n=1 Tax=Cyclostephanos tholiformis TaxID=382380 RepID=A0ABD3RGJ6_9STRA